MTDPSCDNQNWLFTLPPIGRWAQWLPLRMADARESKIVYNMEVSEEVACLAKYSGL